MFRESAAPLRRPGQRQLLDAGRLGRGRVHRWHHGKTPQTIGAERPISARLFQAAAVPWRAPARRVPPDGVLAARRPLLAAALPKIRPDANEDLPGGPERDAPRVPWCRGDAVRLAVLAGAVRRRANAVGAVPQPAAPPELDAVIRDARADLAAASVVAAADGALSSHLGRIQP